MNSREAIQQIDAAVLHQASDRVPKYPEDELEEGFIKRLQQFLNEAEFRNPDNDDLIPIDHLSMAYGIRIGIEAAVEL